MKRWKCLVCGYIHTGEEPPEECPVCGAPRSQFVQIDENDEEIVAETAATEFDQQAAAAADSKPQMNKWKCSVCGYIHIGAEPPDQCPVCGASKDAFILLASDSVPDPAVAPSDENKSEGVFGQTSRPKWLPPAGIPAQLKPLSTFLAKYHAHPITVHIPNGVLPLSVIFMMISLLMDHPGFASAAYYNMIFVLLAMPVVLITGYNDWQRRFSGHLTPVFLTKIICGVIVTVLAAVIVIWLALQPDVLMTPGGARILFLICAGLTTAAAVVAGFFGGKLIIFPGDNLSQ